MADRKIIAVVGSTGAQGGSLVEAILSDPNGGFAARAITRDPTKNKARAITAKGGEVVQADLEQLHCTKKPFANCTLRIPFAHADAWLNALNQARLAIAATYQFTEQELCDHYRSPLGSRRDLVLFQVNFYGFLQEFILREIGAG